MSLLDQNLFINEIENNLNSFIPKNQVDEILKNITSILSSYEISKIYTNDGILSKDDDIVDLFLNAKEVEGRSLATIKHYKRTINKLRQDLEIPLNKITIHHLREWFMKEKERGISLNTLEGNRSVFSSFFNWCWKEELIQKNPTANLTTVKRPKTIRKPFNSVEVEKIKEYATNIRDLAIITFLLSTGCRINEVCNLNREDINLQFRQVKVFGKGSKERIVYLDDVSIMYLKRYFNKRKDDNEALFIGKRNERLQASGVRRMLKRIEKRSGVENIHPHRFRRTLATNLINRGMPIQEVKTILGHEKIETTMDYIYIDQQNVENAYRKYI